jgi:hypothetical protein
LLRDLQAILSPLEMYRTCTEIRHRLALLASTPIGACSMVPTDDEDVQEHPGLNIQEPR